MDPFYDAFTFHLLIGESEYRPILNRSTFSCLTTIEALVTTGRISKKRNNRIEG